MLFETLSQPMVFLWLTVGGFASGLLFDLKNIILHFCKKKRFWGQFLLFLAVFATLFLCFFLNLKTNFGEFRIYPIFAFSLSFAIERFFAQNFLANPVAKCYNKFKGKMDERRTRKAQNQTQNSQS